MSKNHLEIIYLSHGGGPLPLLGDPGHRNMVDFMTELPAKIRKPDVILVVSAHWESPVATLTSASNPGLIYDYYGFPEAAYAIQYPVSGSPDLAHTIADTLQRRQIPDLKNYAFKNPLSIES